MSIILLCQGGIILGNIIEGYWNCPYCGTKGIQGSHRSCTYCGKVRDDNTTFYMKETNNYVPAEKAKNISKSPDWVCSYCNQLNSDEKNSCDSCGAVRTGEELNYFEYKRKQNQRIALSRNGGKPAGIYKPKLIAILILVFVMASSVIYGIGSALSSTKEVTITSFSWSRNIEISQKTRMEDSGWTLPKDARVIDTKKEFYKNEKIVDHYETKTRQVTKQKITGYETYVSGHKDLGNGYFEEETSQRPIYETYTEEETYEEPVYREEPVYKTKYYYEIDKWVHKRNVETSGTDKKPYWGDEKLADNERVESKSEKYKIKTQDYDENAEEYVVSFDKWNSLEEGSKIEVNKASNDIIVFTD